MSIPEDQALSREARTRNVGGDLQTKGLDDNGDTGTREEPGSEAPQEVATDPVQ